MIPKLEEALCRKLTAEECSFIRWIHSWDVHTAVTFDKLLADMFAAGQADANVAHEALASGERLD